MHALVANNVVCFFYMTWILGMWERVLCTWPLDFPDKRTVHKSCQNPMGHDIQSKYDVYLQIFTQSKYLYKT